MGKYSRVEIAGIKYEIMNLQLWLTSRQRLQHLMVRSCRQDNSYIHRLSQQVTFNNNSNNN